MKLIKEKEVDEVSVYKKANIDRKLFSKIKSNPFYQPNKKTVIALALSLELTLDECQFLLNQAGFSLSKAFISDVIIEFFIRSAIYSLDEINAVLSLYDQPTF